MGEHRGATGIAVIKLGAGSQNLRAKIGASSADDFAATTRNRGAARRAAGLDQLRAMGEHRVATGIAVIKLGAGSQNLRTKVGASSTDDFAATTRNRDALRRAAGQHFKGDTPADRSAAQRIAGANLLGAASADCRGAADLRTTQKFQDTPALHGDAADRAARQYLQSDAVADRDAAQSIAGANLLGAANIDCCGAADLRTTQKFKNTSALYGDAADRATRRHLQS